MNSHCQKKIKREIFNVYEHQFASLIPTKDRIKDFNKQIRNSIDSNNHNENVKKANNKNNKDYKPIISKKLFTNCGEQKDYKKDTLNNSSVSSKNIIKEVNDSNNNKYHKISLIGSKNYDVFKTNDEQILVKQDQKSTIRTYKTISTEKLTPYTIKNQILSKTHENDGIASKNTRHFSNETTKMTKFSGATKSTGIGLLSTAKKTKASKEYDPDTHHHPCTSDLKVTYNNHSLSKKFSIGIMDKDKGSANSDPLFDLKNFQKEVTKNLTVVKKNQEKIDLVVKSSKYLTKTFHTNPFNNFSNTGGFSNSLNEKTIKKATNNYDYLYGQETTTDKKDRFMSSQSPNISNYSNRRLTGQRQATSNNNASNSTSSKIKPFNICDSIKGNTDRNLNDTEYAQSKKKEKLEILRDYMNKNVKNPERIYNTFEDWNNDIGVSEGHIIWEKHPGKTADRCINRYGEILKEEDEDTPEFKRRTVDPVLQSGHKKSGSVTIMMNDGTWVNNNDKSITEYDTKNYLYMNKNRVSYNSSGNLYNNENKSQDQLGGSGQLGQNTGGNHHYKCGYITKAYTAGVSGSNSLHKINKFSNSGDIIVPVTNNYRPPISFGNYLQPEQSSTPKNQDSPQNYNSSTINFTESQQYINSSKKGLSFQDHPRTNKLYDNYIDNQTEGLTYYNISDIDVYKTKPKDDNLLTKSLNRNLTSTITSHYNDRLEIYKKARQSHSKETSEIITDKSTPKISERDINIDICRKEYDKIANQNSNSKTISKYMEKDNDGVNYIVVSSRSMAYSPNNPSTSSINRSRSNKEIFHGSSQKGTPNNPKEKFRNESQKFNVFLCNEDIDDGAQRRTARNCKVNGSSLEKVDEIDTHK